MLIAVRIDSVMEKGTRQYIVVELLSLLVGNLKKLDALLVANE